MDRIRSFGLKAGTRVGNYRVVKCLGRCCEGEVYKVAEVPTEAIQALKLFRTDELPSIRHLVHFAWYYEQVRCTGHFPTYYHYGHWFLDDDNGCWFLVFEFINGRPLKEVICSYSLVEKETLFFQLAYAVVDIHEHEYAIGDFSTLENVFLTGKDSIMFIDCNPGEPDFPNCDFENDCKDELIPAAKLIFGENEPECIKIFENKINAIKCFTNHTLTEVLQKNQPTTTKGETTWRTQQKKQKH